MKNRFELTIVTEEWDNVAGCLIDIRVSTQFFNGYVKMMEHINASIREEVETADFITTSVDVNQSQSRRIVCLTLEDEDILEKIIFKWMQP
jgi:hypothetical protein